MNELIEPIISWSALLYGLVALLLIGAVVEYILEKRQKARKIAATIRQASAGN